MFIHFYKKSSIKIAEEKNVCLEKELNLYKYINRQYEKQIEKKNEAILFLQKELDKKDDIMKNILLQCVNIIDKKELLENIVDCLEHLNETININNNK